MALKFLFELWNFRDFIRSFEASTGCPERWPSLDKRGGAVGRGPETAVVCHWPWPWYHHAHIFPSDSQNWLVVTHELLRSCHSFVGECWFDFQKDASARVLPHFAGRPNGDPNRLLKKDPLCLKQQKRLVSIGLKSPTFLLQKKSNIHEPRQTSKPYPHASAGHRKNLRWALMCHCSSNGVFLWRSP